MKRFSLRKGLDVPISGEPKPEIDGDVPVRQVGLIGEDYLGLKPRLSVAEGDAVVPGSPVFSDKDMPEVQITSPVSGHIKAINRGARRKLISIEIEIADHAGGAGEAGAPIDFSEVGDGSTPEGLVERLCAAGLWTSFRTRPYSRVPQPETRPAAIYVTATDTEPLAADPEPVIRAEAEAFSDGLRAISTLSDGETYLCHGDFADFPGSDLPGVEAVAFAGPHPAGLAGTHMHFLVPPGAQRTVWTIGYQDVIVIGRLMRTGRYDPSCVVALTGPACAAPRLIRTVAGASMVDLSAADVPADRPVRLISGSVLSGRAGEGTSAYLGRYARQVTVIDEDREQIPLGWIRPMPGKYAVQPVLGSAWLRKLFPLTSNLNGGRRAMVPLGTFEELMPQDILPTQLLRALVVMDTDQAQALGALELDEEDVALLGFACPAKYEYGIALRDCLLRIEKEG
ncbi:MAG: Na(+)-translocating NADH-quinone reductase subunit A [Pseudomonadota bacterium]